MASAGKMPKRSQHRVSGVQAGEPVEIAVEREMEELMKRLTPIQRRRLQKRLGKGGEEGEGQGVA
jgi:hypothetical protein